MKSILINSEEIEEKAEKSKQGAFTGSLPENS